MTNNSDQPDVQRVRVEVENGEIPVTRVSPVFPEKREIPVTRVTPVFPETEKITTRKTIVVTGPDGTTHETEVEVTSEVEKGHKG